MSHSITSLRGTTRRRRRARRIGSPPVRRLRAQRAPHVDALAVAPPLVAARAARRGGEPQARHQRVELRELVRLERCRSSCRRAAPRRSPSPAARRPRRRRRRPRRAATTTGCRAHPARPRRRPRSRDRTPAARPPARRPCARSSGSNGSSATRSPKIEKKTASKAVTCAGSDTSTARAVQYSRRRAIGRTSASARAKSAARAGVTGTPASCRRRLSAPASGGRSSSIVSTPNSRSLTAASVTAAHELVEAGRADDAPGPPRTSAPSRACDPRPRRPAARRRAG